MHVIVLDRRKKPLMPCTPKRARLLLRRGRARVHRLRPFAIRLVDRTVADCALQPVAVKVDPGSKTTGIAAVRVDDASTHHVLLPIELAHRGASIRKALLGRRAHRRHRRGKLRFRPKRFDNRTRPEGWLAPSLRHRVDTTASWVARLRRWLPVAALAVERVRFDTQLLQDPDVSGVAYQHGTLAGAEVREYLLEKWDRACAYCDARDTPLEVEHILARSRGGSDRASNLAVACHPCNQRKGAMPVEAFVTDPTRLRRILAQAKAPLRDAAAMNATRWALWRALATLGLPLEAATGGRTKWNRTRFRVPKTHANDAACVGTCEGVTGWDRPALAVRATGRGTYQRTRLDAHGFPRGFLTRAKRVRGFATGDLVRAVVPKGKNAGTHVGRVAIRASGNFNMGTTAGTVRDVAHRHCALLQRGDGYAYA